MLFFLVPTLGKMHACPALPLTPSTGYHTQLNCVLASKLRPGTQTHVETINSGCWFPWKPTPGEAMAAPYPGQVQPIAHVCSASRSLPAANSPNMFAAFVLIDTSRSGGRPLTLRLPHRYFIVASIWSAGGSASYTLQAELEAAKVSLAPFSTGSGPGVGIVVMVLW